MTTKPAAAPPLAVRRQEWVNQNPLRAWRLEQEPQITLHDTAARIGVGMSMLQMYERGVHKPGPKAADGLAELLGADWSDRWDRWLASQPKT